VSRAIFFHPRPRLQNNAEKQRNGASTVPSGSASPALVHVRQPASSCDTTRSPPTPGVSARRCRVMASGRIPWGAKSSHHCTRGHRRAAPVAHARRLVWGGLPKFSRKRCRDATAWPTPTTATLYSAARLRTSRGLD